MSSTVTSLHIVLETNPKDLEILGLKAFSHAAVSWKYHVSVVCASHTSDHLKILARSLPLLLPLTPLMLGQGYRSLARPSLPSDSL